MSGCFRSARTCAGPTSVHEQIMPALRRAGMSRRWTDLVVRHTGYADRALRARKLERDTRILHGELVDRPDDPFILFNLGMIAIEHKEWHDALGYLRRSLAGSAPTRFDYAQAVRPDRPRPRDAGRHRRAPCGPVPTGLPSIPRTPSSGSARRSSPPAGRAGRGRKCLAAGPFAAPPRDSSPALTRESMGTSPAATWRPWPWSGAMSKRRSALARRAGRMPRRQGGAEASLH